MIRRVKLDWKRRFFFSESLTDNAPPENGQTTGRKDLTNHTTSTPHNKNSGCGGVCETILKSFNLFYHDFAGSWLQFVIIQQGGHHA